MVVVGRQYKSINHEKLSKICKTMTLKIHFTHEKETGVQEIEKKAEKRGLNFQTCITATDFLLLPVKM